MKRTDTRTPSAPAEGKRSIEGCTPATRFLPHEMHRLREHAARIGVRVTTLCREAPLREAEAGEAGLLTPQTVVAMVDCLTMLEAKAGDLALQARHFRQRLTGEAIALAIEAEPELAGEAGPEQSVPQPVPRVSEAA